MKRRRIRSKTHDDMHLSFAATGTTFDFEIGMDVNNRTFLLATFERQKPCASCNFRILFHLLPCDTDSC